MDSSTVVLVMRAGGRICVGPAEGAVAIRVLSGHVEVHVGDEWDQLPYPTRHIEGACSFFALFDHSIDLSAGSLLAIERGTPQDIEALDDSELVLDLA